MMPSLRCSPGGFMSPPTLASTPSIPYPRLSVPFELSFGNRSAPRQNIPFSITELPVLVLDKIFALLSDQDLRAFHQVSHLWNSALECRVGDNNRRLELVRKIRENKENILNGSKELPTPNLIRVNNNKERTCDKKSEDIVLIECTNTLNTSDVSSTKDNATENQLLTPKSRFAFQSFEEVERSLKKGQKLFRCRKCTGPVPSPIVAGAGLEEDNEESEVAKSKIEATRCRLTSRMEIMTPDNSLKRDRKKSKTSKSMPPPLSPIDIRTTTALCDRMSQSLVISGASRSPSECRKGDQLNREILVEVKDIDLHMSKGADASSIDFKLNFTNSFDAALSPFNWKYSRNSIVESGLSDTELSWDDNGDKSSFFPCYIPSPEPMKVLSLECNDKLKNISTAVQEDLKKPITLISSFGGSILNGNVGYFSNEHDKYDIDSSTYECHNKSINDINGTDGKSLIVCGDSDGQKSTIVSLVPSLSCSDYVKSARSTSDYFSSTGSILRDCSKSNFPDLSTGRYEMVGRSLNDSAVCHNQSVKNTSNVREAFDLSLESNLSYPNLNESFVLECPNPDCSFRFCSTCSMAEHIGRPCHIINSDSFEELNESNDKCFGNIRTNKNKPKTGNDSLGTGKGKGTGNSNKEKSLKKLRRIAKL